MSKIVRNVIYIGEDFYWKSGTMMSSLYLKVEDKYRRCDWGIITTWLQNGEKVNIAPAKKSEIAFFEAILSDDYE